MLPIIYEVREHFTAFDGDGYYHWVDSNHISYHSTEENAKRAIDYHLFEQLCGLNETANLNLHLDADYFEDKFFKIQKNEYWYKKELGDDLFYVAEIYCVD